MTRRNHGFARQEQSELHVQRKCVLKLAYVSGHKTNHSLRATGATSELFEAGVPEMREDGTQVTGSEDQAVSVILSSSQKSSFKDALIDRKIKEQAALALDTLEQSRTTCFRTAMCMYTKGQ